MYKLPVNDWLASGLGKGTSKPITPAENPPAGQEEQDPSPVLDAMGRRRIDGPLVRRDCCLERVRRKSRRQRIARRTQPAGRRAGRSAR